MKAFVVEAPFKASVQEVAEPACGPDEIRIAVERVGICGTDHHIFKGEFLSPYPIIPGHEFSGTIDQIGENVSSFTVGERVTADPTLVCGACYYCQTQRFNHCEQWGAIGNTVNGAMAEKVVVPAKNVMKLPDQMSFGEGAFVEPVACVVHGMNQLNAKAGDRAILFGVGAMGQQLVQALVKVGVSELTVVDVEEDKLALAVEWGATRGVLSTHLDEELAEERLFDIVVDATGIPAVVQKAFTFLGPAATYLQFGVTPQGSNVQLDPFTLYHKDLKLLGSMAINQTFIPAFHWVANQRVSVEHLIRRTVTLEDLAQYFQDGPTAKDMKTQLQI